jgi:hypothetical protein
LVSNKILLHRCYYPDPVVVSLRVQSATGDIVPKRGQASYLRLAGRFARHSDPACAECVPKLGGLAAAVLVSGCSRTVCKAATFCAVPVCPRGPGRVSACPLRSGLPYIKLRADRPYRWDPAHREVADDSIRRPHSPHTSSPASRYLRLPGAPGSLRGVGPRRALTSWAAMKPDSPTSAG